MKDPSLRAEEMIEAYRNNFIGRVGPAARSVANRYATVPDTDESVLGNRGPYLQALDIPNWSDQSWESFCRSENVNPLIRSAFSDLGFSRLYRFQERTVASVKAGNDTVVTAATGRGKTEAWLIPILDQILTQKRQEDEQSVKALLIYPTKALAQDQFKRLVQYLYRINDMWPASEQITIGIYDGDTPTNVGSNAQGYLQSSFKYFECPGRNDDLEKCQTCGQGVRIHHAGQRYELQPEKRQCIEDVPLDFIRLTKNQILSEGVDILLTNPDTINRKLVNTNAPDEHETFIYQPDFLVFDEVHTYDGLFGSFTSMLTKRLRALRSQRDCDDLQVIASSATVDNDVELFRQISGSQSIQHIDEQPRQLPPADVDSPPEELLSEQLESDDLVAFARNDRSSTVLSEVEFEFNPAEYDNDRLRELLEEALFEHFTTETTDPVVNTIQHLHHALSAEPRQRSDFLEYIEQTFALDRADAQTLLENFQTLGTFSGLLENRVHLFSWPIDGFYACAACDAVYRSPQDSCTKCGFGFVTRSTYCNSCDDEALVAWYCPACDQLDPYLPSDEGEQQFDDEHACQRCRQARNETVRTLRVTFHPTLECQDCEYTTDRSPQQQCTDCGTTMVHTDPETHTCPNPACEATQPHQSGCPACGGQQRPLTGEGQVDCPNCGRTHPHSTMCECGMQVVQTRFLPWVCRNDACDRTHFEKPTDSCGCDSSSTFARQGLFEIFEDTYCEDCDTSYISDLSCSCPTTGKHREGAHQKFKTFEPDGSIRSVTSIPSVAPCQHRGVRYNPDRRYDELVRGPGNLAVTTGQYLLRRISEDEGLESAKQLSFADSHRDMKELDRDFREPEVGTLLDQCILESIQSGEDTWVPLSEIVEDSLARIDTLHETLSPPQDVQDIALDLRSELVDSARQDMETETAIRDRLIRRAIPHSYSARYREFGGALAESGILDLRLEPTVYGQLSGEEQQVVANLAAAGNDATVESITDDVQADAEGTLESLNRRRIVQYDGDRVCFHPEVIQLTTAGAGDELHYVPENGSIEQTINKQAGLLSNDVVPFETSVTDLADPSHPRFDGRAYRAQYSTTQVLLSRVYHGMTDKRERRELEYLFREGKYPHFLSSGPTMELGVDIGELDTLLLYGTPPNMNAYLQRIGRAGRSSNTSLVHSVSQRNPIDYYYYDQPGDLMAADPQPVPLKEFNEEVVQISLTWAVFDYIAANFVIPWNVEDYGRYKSVSNGDTFYARKPTVDDDAAKLTHVMSARTSTLELGEPQSQFDVLETIVHDYRHNIEKYLQTLLEYKFCELCSKKYDRDVDTTRCREGECSGRLVDAIDEYGHLASEAIDDFAERYLHSYETHLENLREDVSETKEEIRTAKQERKRTNSQELARQLRLEEESLRDRKDALEQQVERLKNLSYVDFLRESRQSRYAFDMRTVSENVAVSLVDKDDGEFITRTVGENDGRSIRMAISELHPHAAYLDGGETYIVSHLTVDEYESTELQRIVQETDESELCEQFRCPECGQTYENSQVSCNCGTEKSVIRERLVSPETVTAHRSDLSLSNGDHTAREFFNQPESGIQNTYANSETEVLSFDSMDEYTIETSTGETKGTLQYGSFTVLVHASSYRAKYKNGAIDSEPTPFEVCGHSDCTGVIYRDDQNQPYCSSDSTHQPDGDEGSEYVRLGYAYKTDGLRIELDEVEKSHVFAHGIRLALQYLGGVSIRDIDEYVPDGDATTVDIFDSQEGGAGIARLLVADTDNFEKAVDLMREHFTCECRDGCPLCLYQYGCATRNQNDTFDLTSITELLEGERLRLVE